MQTHPPGSLMVAELGGVADPDPVITTESLQQRCATTTILELTELSTLWVELRLVGGVDRKQLIEGVGLR